MSMSINMNYGISNMMGLGGMMGVGFGYNSMNSMIGSMFGGFGGGLGMGGMMGGYGMGSMMGGLSGMLGIQGSMSLPIFGNSIGNAWATNLDTTLGKRDPVYLDTNHDGQLNVEKLKKNISFDMNGDGINDTVKEWNTKDAQLVYDANGDGKINSGREMMNEVGVNGEQNKYKNGWEKAKDLFDTDKDGFISSKELEKAKFWTDANGNGKVDEGELKTAAEMGIVGIDPKNGKFMEQHQIGNLNLNFGFGMMGGMPMMGGFGGGLGMGSIGGGFGGGLGMGSIGGGFGGLGMGSIGGGLGMMSGLGNGFGAGFGIGSMMGGMNGMMGMGGNMMQLMLQQLMMQQQSMFSASFSFTTM